MKSAIIDIVKVELIAFTNVKQRVYTNHRIKALEIYSGVLRSRATRDHQILQILLRTLK